MKLFIHIALTTFIIITVCGCLKESDTLIKRKMLVILEDDLKSVVQDIKKEGIADSSFFNIVEYKEYKGGTYTKKAVVDFIIFKDIDVKIVRKYRYHSGAKKWERYFNEYKFYDNDNKK